ncbi:hypothetical protein [uncultured Amphritea sp.]|uniref:hypothetical protein n=1 Tax=uncultured Amphritea sp. TaxID=981605 RepID=UPI002637D123|nr:hypothetical protein [uncultured Amphritea sp.]
MKIAVILTPDTDDLFRQPGEQALESIREALLLKQNDRASKVIVVSIGQPLSKAQSASLIRQGVDYTLFRACDRSPGAMELAELFIEIVQLESPDLIFIGRDEKDSQCQLGNLLAELLEFRLSQSQPGNGQHYRTLVIREIGNGMHTVRISLLQSGSLNPFCLEECSDSISRKASLLIA